MKDRTITGLLADAQQAKKGFFNSSFMSMHVPHSTFVSHSGHCPACHRSKLAGKHTKENNQKEVKDVNQVLFVR